MLACIICGSNEKTVYRTLNGMKISLCIRHEDHASGTDGMKEMPLLQYVQP